MDRLSLALRSLSATMARLERSEPLSRRALHEQLRHTRYWLLTAQSEITRSSLQSCYGSLLTGLPPLSEGCPACGQPAVTAPLSEGPETVLTSPSEAPKMLTPEQLWANHAHSQQPTTETPLDPKDHP
jgi:hypothetical protein